MKVHISHSKYTGITGRLLALELGQVLGQEVTASRKTLPKDTTHLIRWGNSLKADWDNLAANTLNMAHSIALTAQREHTLRALRGASVSVPNWHRDLIDQNRTSSWVIACERFVTPQEATPLYVLRQRYGFGGRDVLPWTDGTLVPAGYHAPFLVQYIPNKLELRVHVINGRSIRMQIKVNEQGLYRTEEPFMVRNHERGWHFVPFGGELARQVGVDRRPPRDLAKNAVAAVGLDFGAVDLVLSLDGCWYVLEVNSAPGLDEGSRLRYIRGLALWCHNTEGHEHIRHENLHAALGYSRQETNQQTRERWGEIFTDASTFSSQFLVEPEPAPRVSRLGDECPDCGNLLDDEGYCDSCGVYPFDSDQMEPEEQEEDPNLRW